MEKTPRAAGFASLSSARASVPDRRSGALRSLLDAGADLEARAVHVGAQVLRRAEHRKAPHADVLADLGNERAPALLDALAGGELRLPERRQARRLRGQGAFGHCLGEGAEALLAGDEVGL